MAFRFGDLSTELALEIIGTAATPDYLHPSYDGTHEPYYFTAVNLSYVSFTLRQAAMSHLLNTVVLNTHRNHLAFSRAILLQQKYRREGSRLAIDYTQYIRRFWSSSCHPTMAGQWHISMDELDFDLFADILCSVETLGFNFRSLHLLYLSLANKNTGRWKCRKLILAGPTPRWNPLVQNPEGAEFLRNITHLAVWIPYTFRNSENRGRIIAPEIRNLPFDTLSSLQYFACSLWDPNADDLALLSLPKEALVYGSEVVKGGVGVQEILKSEDPGREGVVVPFRWQSATDFDSGDPRIWETGFFEYRAEDTWARAEI